MLALLTTPSWPIGGLNYGGSFRKGLNHRVISLNHGTEESQSTLDDEVDCCARLHYLVVLKHIQVEFNTQCSSQWDSLCILY